MKWSGLLLSLGLLTCSVLAAPHPGPSDGLDLYKLKIKSPSNAELEGRYLSLNGSDVGLFVGTEASAIKVYQTTSQRKGCNQLHTYPIGIIDHALALVGPPEIMTLSDIANPAKVVPDDGQVMLWDTFKVSNSRLANDGPGGWLAFPGAKDSWKLKWTDVALTQHYHAGNAITSEDYMPVQIMMEAAGQGHANN
ncbi:hypothetical protein F5Y17DRAFT_231712 [Xylariaceae sp. FL0594]|nr:hypothetical protein F5Y17DRAFT_231712 [Xylariaceae sp. FL0594]